MQFRQVRRPVVAAGRTPIVAQLSSCGHIGRWIRRFDSQENLFECELVYGLLRTRDAVTPSLTTRYVAVSLAAYVAVYAIIYAFGLFYIYRLLRDGPADEAASHDGLTPGRPAAVALPSGAE